MVKQTDYDQMTSDFLKRTGTEIDKKYLGIKKHFADDKNVRNMWSITLTRGIMQWQFTFGDSIHNTDNDIIQMSASYSTCSSDLPLTLVLNHSIRNTVVEYSNRFEFQSGGRSFSYRKRPNAQHVPPSDYSILSCVAGDSYFNCKDEFEFASEYDYKINCWDEYKKVRDEYQKSKEAADKIDALFGDCIDELREM